jgi:hypothetical protein
VRRVRLARRNSGGPSRTPWMTLDQEVEDVHRSHTIREKEMKSVVKAAREFFKSFENLNFRDLSTPHIKKILDAHHLSVKDFISGYSKGLKNFNRDAEHTIASTFPSFTKDETTSSGKLSRLLAYFQ